MKEWIKFKIHNYKHNIGKFEIELNNKHNIGLLLAAGTSSRFNTNNTNNSKQLFLLNNKPIIKYSIDAIINSVDNLVIITNSKCYEEIMQIVDSYDDKLNLKLKIKIIINDVNDRIESIKVGLNYLNKNYDINYINKIIIHDSARPYITENHMKKMIEMPELYIQYCLSLTNGLAVEKCKKVNNFKKYKVEDRNKYIELCSPICCNYSLYNFIFSNYVNTKFTIEIIPILNRMKIDYILLTDYYKYLRKITTIEDIY
jgi:2-C-methyl-D-erythritol 4-phosphate cytidylyltransferase